MEMNKVSIIVPVYNVAQYVTQCMDSLYRQSFSDIEVIFVDDRGSDNSVQIVKDYISSRDLQQSWHVVYMPENGKPGKARNYGLTFATGEYVMFIDADDWIEKEMVELLYCAAQSNNADISSAAAICDYADGTYIEMHNPYVGSGLVTDNQRRYLLRHYVSNFTTMLFKRAWLLENGILFPPAYSGEDSSFMGQCYLVCRRIAQSEQVMYHYRIHTSSISHSSNFNRGRQKRVAFHALINFAREKKLLSKYRWTIYWVYLKKAILIPLKEYFSAITSC